jgi:hypothetical protein
MVDEYSDEELDAILDEVFDWGMAFSKSRYFRGLTEEQKRESEFIVMSFTEFMYVHHGLSNSEWDEEGLEECCSETLPRKISADEPYFKSIAPVLSAFFEFLGDKGLLRNAPNLVKRIKEIDNKIVKNAADPKNWGMSKSFFIAAKDAGFDLTKEDERNKFIELYNRQQLAKPKNGQHSQSKDRQKRSLPLR